MSNPTRILFRCLFIALHLIAVKTWAQTSVNARIDARQITIGDQARLFLEVTHNFKQDRLQWAPLPDTFNSLEIVEKGKIDTFTQGDIATYKQRLLVTGFDSGLFQIPAFTFSVMPKTGTPYTLQTDSFQLLVSNIAVDTTQPFKPIKGIMVVKTTWLDYLWIILGIVIFVLLALFVFYYFIRNKKTEIPRAEPKKPVETLQQRILRLLDQLEKQQLWQSGRVKEYHSQLTDILRTYIEERFRTPAMELTTDEMLAKVKMHPEMQKHYDQLAGILYTADLAKFAKAEPTPHEHTASMEATRQFVANTTPATNENSPKQP